MSSYELLELLEYMPERGAFRTACRDGELCLQDEIARHGVNEIARLRATMHAVHGGAGYSPKLYYSIAELREFQEEQGAAADGREQVYAYATRSRKGDDDDEGGE